MRVVLRDLLNDRAEAVEPPRLEALELVALGRRQVRNRRRISVAAVVVAVVSVVGTTGVLVAQYDRTPDPARPTGPTGPSPTADGGTASVARPLTLGLDQTIHLGDESIDTGHNFLSLDVTDDGAAFTTLDGGIWFTDGVTVEQLGATIGGDVADRGHGVSWSHSRPPQWVATDTVGSLVTWLEYPSSDRPELVAYDSLEDQVIGRHPLDRAAGRRPEIATVVGDTAYVALSPKRETIDMTLLSVDVTTGHQEMVSRETYEAALRGRPRSLALDAADGPVLDTPTGSGFLSDDDGSRLFVSDGHLVATDDRALFDPVSGDRIDLRVPTGYVGAFYPFQWLSDDQLALIGTARTGAAPTGAVLVCEIAAERCEVVRPPSTISTAPLLPGFGGVGAEMALVAAMRE